MIKKCVLIILLFQLNYVLADNSIIAIVDDFIITKNSISADLNSVETFEQKLNVINNEIDNILIQQKAKNLELEHNEEDINNAVIEIADKNNIPIEEFKNNSDFSIFLKKIIHQLNVMAFKQLFYNEVYTNITDEEIITICNINQEQDKIKQIKLSQIIIYQLADKKNQEKSIKELLNTIANNIKTGGSFNELAKIHSQEDSINSDWIILDEHSENFANLKYDEVSDIYEHQSGWAIATKINERYMNPNIDNCKKILIQERAQKYYLDWINKLRDSSYIKIFSDKI